MICEDETTDLEDEIEVLKETIKNNNEESSSEKEQLGSQIKKQKEKMQSMEQNATDETNELQNKIIQIQVSLDTSKVDVETLKDKIDATENFFIAALAVNDMLSKREQVRDLKIRNDQLRLLEQANADTKNAIDEKNMSEEKYNELFRRASELESELNYAKQDVSDTKQEVSDAKKDGETAVKKLRTEIGILQGKYSLAKNTIVTLGAKIVTLRDEKVHVTSEKKHLEDRLKAKDKSYNTTAASNVKELALKDKIIKNTRADNEELLKEKDQREDDFKSREEKYNTTITSNEKQLASKGVEVTRLQETVEQQRRNERETLVEVKQEHTKTTNKQLGVLNAQNRKEKAKNLRDAIKKNTSTVHVVDSDTEDDDDYDDYDDKVDGKWNDDWDHPNDQYDEHTGKLITKVMKYGPENRYPPRNPPCTTCNRGRGCRGANFAECGNVRYECAGGCGCKLIGKESTFWAHVRGNVKNNGCHHYAKKFSKHILACEVKGGYQTFRLKKNEDDDAEDSVQMWLDTL